MKTTNITVRELEALRSSQDLKASLKGHGLTIKALAKANGVTPANVKKYWEKKIQRNVVANVIIGGYIAVALGGE